MPREAVDEHVENWMMSFLARPENRARIAAPRGQTTMNAIQTSVDEAHERALEVEAGFCDGELDWGTYRRLDGLLRSRLEAIETQLAQTQAAVLAADYLRLTSTEDVQQKWRATPLYARRVLLAVSATVHVQKSSRPPPYDVHTKVILTALT
ncbi:hypothetical protein [Cellulomonas hominis]